MGGQTLFWEEQDYAILCSFQIYQGYPACQVAGATPLSQAPMWLSSSSQLSAPKLKAKAVVDTGDQHTFVQQSSISTLGFRVDGTGRQNSQDASTPQDRCLSYVGNFAISAWHGVNHVTV